MNREVAGDHLGIKSRCAASLRKRWGRVLELWALRRPRDAMNSVAARAPIDRYQSSECLAFDNSLSFSAILPPPPLGADELLLLHL